MLSLKTISIQNSLSKKYGGKWTFNRSAREWHCEDKIRYVCYVISDIYDEYSGSKLMMYYLDNSKSPERVYL